MKLYTQQKSFHQKVLQENCPNKMYLTNFYILLAFSLLTIPFFDSCSYLLLLDKISRKTKTFTTLLLCRQQIKRNQVLKIYYQMTNLKKLVSNIVRIIILMTIKFVDFILIIF